MSTTGAAAPLFVAPGLHGKADGDVAALRPGLEPAIPVVALEGLVLRDPGDDLISEIAAACIDEIRAIQPHGPYRIAGFSFGGHVAGAIACRLEAMGERVELLLILDTAVRLDAVPPRPAGGMARLMAAGRRHGWRVYGGRATLIRTWERPLRHLGTPGLGWEYIAAGGVAVFDLPTTHWGLIAPPFADRLAEIVAGLLGQRLDVPQPDILLPHTPLPEALHHARSLLILNRPGDALAALRRAPPRSLPTWTRRLAVAALSRDARLHEGEGAIEPAGAPPLMQAELLVDEKRYADALPLLDPSAHAPGRHRETILLARAICARKAGAEEEAAALLAQLRERLEDTPDRFAAASFELMAAGLLQASTEFGRRAVERGNAPARAWMVGVQAQRALSQRDWDRAARLATRAIQDLPQISQFYPAAIAALSMLGQKEQARRIYDRAVERYAARAPVYLEVLDRALAIRAGGRQAA